MEKYSTQPFAKALGDILREEHGDQFGRFSLRSLLSKMSGMSEEGFRLQITGERTLKIETVIEAAKALGIAPDYFLEYRAHWVSTFMQRDPEAAHQIYEFAKALDAVRSPQQEAGAGTD